MRAWLAIRDAVHYRRDAFAHGLEKLGYSVQYRLTDKPGPRDVLVIWNRYGEFARCADVFESRGLKVLVAENGYLGNSFCGERHYALSRSQHNGAGQWPMNGPERWDSYGYQLKAPVSRSGEILILPQRGIGPPGVAMPRDWDLRTRKYLKVLGYECRVRVHPGTRQVKPLEEDLQNVSAAVTWGSGAGLKALAHGIPVYSDFHKWIGATAAYPIEFLTNGTQTINERNRLEMFRRLAWAQWSLDEIRSGHAIRALLS